MKIKVFKNLVIVFLVMGLLPCGMLAQSTHENDPLNSEEKKGKEIVRSIYDDILKIKNKYEELKNFGTKKDLERVKNNGMISYSQKSPHIYLFIDFNIYNFSIQGMLGRDCLQPDYEIPVRGGYLEVNMEIGNEGLKKEVLSILYKYRVLATTVSVPVTLNDSQKEVIRIATEKAKELGYSLKNMGIILYDEDHKVLKQHLLREGISVYDEETNQWIPEQPTTPEEEYPALKGRGYQAVYFGPKNPQKGGDLWVFVDKDTGEVITYICGQ